jgi:hypothetical protein
MVCVPEPPAKTPLFIESEPFVINAPLPRITVLALQVNVPVMLVAAVTVKLNDVVPVVESIVFNVPNVIVRLFPIRI